MAELFDTSPEGELDKNSVSRDFLHTATDHFVLEKGEFDGLLSQIATSSSENGNQKTILFCHKKTGI